ncbi:MAG: hypothetical protein LBD87_07495 [Prevotellaceae bacterium]|jgi:hypothetical protein|nr:hypothetical protein [Prevotellaceae bacterium]
MKKIFLSFLSLMGLGFPALAQSHINIELLSATYTTPAVQFRVSWDAIPEGTCHNSKIWLWVDFIKIENNQPSGTWTRATVANPSPGTFEADNNKGFWLQGNSSSYSQIVTVALTNIQANAKFNWCAYASDCPPNVTINNGTYTLKGTPPFIINTSIIEKGKSYSGGCITSLTDATGCSGIIPVFSAGAIQTTAAYKNCYNTSGSNISEAVHPSGGSGAYTYQWTVSYNGNSSAIINGATGATYTPPATTTAGTYVYRRQVRDNLCNTTFSLSEGTVTRIVLPDYISICGIDVKMCDAGRSTHNPGNLCPTGWRWPSALEGCCMSMYPEQLNLTQPPYWVSTKESATVYLHFWTIPGTVCINAGCNYGTLCTPTDPLLNNSVRCVR